MHGNSDLATCTCPGSREHVAGGRVRRTQIYLSEIIRESIFLVPASCLTISYREVVAVVFCGWCLEKRIIFLEITFTSCTIFNKDDSG